MSTDIGLRERLSNDMKQAMKDRDTFTRDTLRLLLSAVKNAEIDKRADLTEEEGESVLRKQAKQRQDSIEQYRSAGRDDLADHEAAELVVLEKYLPQQMTDDELSALVAAVIAETGATGPRDMGKAMGILTKRVEGRADGRRMSGALKTALAEQG